VENVVGLVKMERLEHCAGDKEEGLMQDVGAGALELRLELEGQEFDEIASACQD